ncbi:MAG: aldo/keto reductase [Chitinispirillaceae bacterium]|nr:aldo/keto reductase [Chitinispirillaceae bacterium]
MMSVAADTEKRIDPATVPAVTLSSGARLPMIGLGTFGNDRYSPQQIAEAVRYALSIGYRHIDCASVYGNEDAIGCIVEEAIRSGIPREELWITSKLWNDKHAEEDVIPSCEKTLKDLHLDYLDLYLIHWPFPNFHAKGVDVSSRDPNARPYIHAAYMKTWCQLEKLVKAGKVRHIGTSNMTIPKLRLLLRDAEIKPVSNEFESHPHFQQLELFEFLQANDIVPIAFSPIGSPCRPERDRTPQDTVDIEDPVIVKIAEQYGVHPAVICIKWAIARGQIPIPLSVTPSKIRSNLEATITPLLSDGEMKEIAGIDKNCRLVKGQVFLWKTEQSWEALWDVNGKVTPP